MTKVVESSDQLRILCLDSGGQVRIWDKALPKSFREFIPHDPNSFAAVQLAVVPNSTDIALITSGSEGVWRVLVVDVARIQSWHKELYLSNGLTLRQLDQPMRVTASHDGNLIAVAGSPGATGFREFVSVYRRRKAKSVFRRDFTKSLQPTFPTFAHLSADGSRVLTLSTLGGRSWDLHTQSPLPCQAVEYPKCVGFSKGLNEFCMAFREDLKIVIRSASDGSRLMEFDDPSEFKWLEFSPLGDRILAAAANGDLHMFDTVTGDEVAKAAIPTGRGRIDTIGFGASSRRVLIAVVEEGVNRSDSDAASLHVLLWKTEIDAQSTTKGGMGR